MAFEVGQHVECINDDWGLIRLLAPSRIIFPKKGDVLTVAKMTTHRCCARHGETLFLYFQESATDAAYLSIYFQPLTSDRLDQFRKLVAPVPDLPARVPEEVA